MCTTAILTRPIVTEAMSLSKVTAYKLRPLSEMLAPWGARWCGSAYSPWQETKLTEGEKKCPNWS
jgi:hypothetical protein